MSWELEIPKSDMKTRRRDDDYDHRAAQAEMIITNKFNLPEPIVEFLKQDFYDYDVKGDSISTTQLLKPIREIVLLMRHSKEIEVDVSTMLWKVLGSGVHAVLEKLKEENSEVIKRMFATVGDVRVSGKFDRIKDKKVTDYKVTSVWTVVYNSRETEWKEQLSIYRWLWYINHAETLKDTGSIIAILRDHNDKDMGKTNYPPIAMVEIEIPLLSLEETHKFIVKKVAAVKDAMKLEDKNLPLCTDEERWWNAKKQIYNKCEHYCNAYKFCNQAQEIFPEPNLESLNAG